jgi:hypothetical protein
MLRLASSILAVVALMVSAPAAGAHHHKHHRVQYCPGLPGVPCKQVYIWGGFDCTATPAGVNTATCKWVEGHFVWKII